MAERVTVSDMMDAREARAQAQRALLARYPGASVVCLCMNIAGSIKRTENIERAFAWGLRNVKAVLAPCETLFDAAIHEKTGPEAMLCVRADARAIKRRLCALEDGEALGRLLDIDVIAPDGGKISATLRRSAREAARTARTRCLKRRTQSSTRTLRRRLRSGRRKTPSARCSSRWR